MADYQRLDVWKAAHRVTLAVYRATERFPSTEVYGLTSQIRRAAVSIPANLAEGYGRGTDREIVRYCRVCVGSANELEYHLILARDLGLLAAAEQAELESESRRVRRMLAGLIRAIGQTARM